MRIEKLKRNGEEMFVALMDRGDLAAVLEAMRLWLLIVEVQEQIQNKQSDPSLKRGKNHEFFGREEVKN